MSGTLRGAHAPVETAASSSASRSVPDRSNGVYRSGMCPPAFVGRARRVKGSFNGVGYGAKRDVQNGGDFAVTQAFGAEREAALVLLRGGRGLRPGGAPDAADRRVVSSGPGAGSAWSRGCAGDCLWARMRFLSARLWATVKVQGLQIRAGFSVAEVAEEARKTSWTISSASGMAMRLESRKTEEGSAELVEEGDELHLRGRGGECAGCRGRSAGDGSRNLRLWPPFRSLADGIFFLPLWRSVFFVGG